MSVLICRGDAVFREGGSVASWFYRLYFGFGYLISAWMEFEIPYPPVVVPDSKPLPYSVDQTWKKCKTGKLDYIAASYFILRVR